MSKRVFLDWADAFKTSNGDITWTANCKQMRVLPSLEDEVKPLALKLDSPVLWSQYCCKPDNTLSKFVSRALIPLPQHKTRVGQSGRYTWLPEEAFSMLTISMASCRRLCNLVKRWNSTPTSLSIPTASRSLRINCRDLQGCLAAMRTCAPLILAVACRLKS